MPQTEGLINVDKGRLRNGGFDAAACRWRYGHVRSPARLMKVFHRKPLRNSCGVVTIGSGLTRGYRTHICQDLCPRANVRSSERRVPLFVVLSWGV